MCQDLNITTNSSNGDHECEASVHSGQMLTHSGSDLGEVEHRLPGYIIGGAAGKSAEVILAVGVHICVSD